MWWSLDHDDHWGSCGEGRFPLTNAVNKVFKSNTDCPTITGSSITTTRRTTTTTATTITTTISGATASGSTASGATNVATVGIADGLSK